MAAASLSRRTLDDHTCSFLILLTSFELADALLVETEPQRILHPPQHHQVLRQIPHQVKLGVLKHFYKKLLAALVLGSVSPVVLLRTDFARHFDVKALELDVVKQFWVGQMLELGLATNFATEFRALLVGVLLELVHCSPDDLGLGSVHEASVGELAKVNAVP